MLQNYRNCYQKNTGDYGRLNLPDKQTENDQAQRVHVTVTLHVEGKNFKAGV